MKSEIKQIKFVKDFFQIAIFEVKSRWLAWIIAIWIYTVGHNIWKIINLVWKIKIRKNVDVFS